MGKYFGTDGIRGRANETLTLEQAFRVGRFLGHYYAQENKAIIIGMDTRISSMMFENILASAISSSGVDVHLLGYCSTPALAYITKKDNYACGIMISASHNPYIDNGIKIFGNNGLKINDEIEYLIEEYIDNPVGIEYAVDDNIGRIIENKERINDYIDWLCHKYPNDLSNHNIIIDLANGSNCYTAKKVYDRLNGNFKYINDNPNGININNNCGSTNLKHLSDEVIKGQYQMGIAFDGDADRVKFVDYKGQEVSGDKIMFILAKYLKDKNLLNNNTLVTTVMSNIGLYKALDNNKISYITTAVGDKNVADALIEGDYVIGGEESGHIIYKNDSNFGDGLKTSLLLLEALDFYKTDLIEASKEVFIYPQLLINIRVKDKNIVLEDLDIKNKIAEIEKRLNNDGRILVRPSGTEPLIRVMVEAQSDELCKQLVNEVIDLIKLKKYHEE